MAADRTTISWYLLLQPLAFRASYTRDSAIDASRTGTGHPTVSPWGIIPPWPPVDDDVRAALEAAYADGSWGRYHGRFVPALEQAIAEFHGTPHVTLCSSGTIAVELALRGLKVGPCDEVLLAGYDFPGNFRAIEAVGARPALVDLAPQSWCMDADLLETAIGPETRAMIVSHLHGTLAPMDRVMAIARERGIAVVEDACQSPGALVAGRMAGAWGDVGVLSFGGSKLLTAGRGGALVTASAEIHQRIKVYMDRGNNAFPLSELQAAVLIPQLAKLPASNEARLQRAGQLTAALSNASLEFASAAAPSDRPAYYKLATRFNGGGRVGRDQLLAALAARGLPFDAGFRGFALRGSKRCRQATELPYSQSAATDTILLHHPVLLSSPETIGALARETNAVLAATFASPTT